MARRFMYEIPIGGIPPTRRKNYEVNDSNYTNYGNYINDSNYISDYNARIIQEAANANQQRLQQNRQERNALKYNLERENALRTGIPNSMYPTTREEMDILNQSIIDRNINNPANLSTRYSFKHGGRIKARYGLPTDPLYRTYEVNDNTRVARPIIYPEIKHGFRPDSYGAAVDGVQGPLFTKDVYPYRFVQQLGDLYVADGMYNGYPDKYFDPTHRTMTKRHLDSVIYNNRRRKQRDVSNLLRR